MASRSRKLIADLGLFEPAASFKTALDLRRDGRPSPGPPGAGQAGAAPRRGVFRMAGSGVGYLLRAPASLRYFLRGYRYGKRLKAPAEVDPVGGAAPERNTPLGDYFDAHTEGLALFKRRHYLPIYERHLERFRGRPLTLLEIGVFAGGSLEMWREYLGPQAHIYGVDVDEGAAVHAREGIEIIIGDQADPDFWAGLLQRLPPFDVVLDDGGHKPGQQAVTLECVLPHIRPGGVYLCEDVGGSFQPFHSFVDGLTRPLSAIGVPGRHVPVSPLQQHVGSVHRYPMVVVIEKPAGPVSFQAVRRGGGSQAREGTRA